MAAEEGRGTRPPQPEESAAQKLATVTADAILSMPLDRATEMPLAKIIAEFPAIKLLTLSSVVRSLAASKWLFSESKKSWVEAQDTAGQQKASEWIRDTSEGKPAQSTYNFNVDAGGGKLNAMEIMAGDPKAVAMLRELADKAEAAQKRGANGGRPQKVVVEAVSDAKPAAAPVPPA